jgi:hypothetical protein
VAHAVSRGSSPGKNRNGLHPYAPVHEKATNIPGPESHPEKNSDDAWAWWLRISLLYTANLTGHFQFGREPRLFIVAPCIQMELHYKELSPNEEAHFSDTGDVFADVRSNDYIPQSSEFWQLQTCRSTGRTIYSDWVLRLLSGNKLQHFSGVQPLLAIGRKRIFVNPRGLRNHLRQ